MTERIDRRVADLVAAAEPTPELPPGWESRVVEQLRVPWPARRRRIWKVVAVAAAVVFALGFVPFPSGKATGALDRALASIDAARTLHIVFMTNYALNTIRNEEWWSKDGFDRTDYNYNEGRFLDVHLREPGRVRSYHTRLQPADIQQHGLGHGTDEDQPPFLPTMDTPPTEAQEQSVRRIFNLMRDHNGWSIHETKRTSLWGGTIMVLDMQGISKTGSMTAPATHVPSDTVRYHAEIDADTGLLLTLSQEVFDEETLTWQKTFWTESVEWNVEIPEEAHQFTFPAGMKVTQVRWWTGRTEQVIAEAESADWLVRIHAVEVDAQGRLYLTFSKWCRTDRAYYGSTPTVTARDVRGITYTPVSRNSTPLSRNAGDYWTMVLQPDQKPNNLSVPSQVTFTINPSLFSKEEQQPITLTRIPLPAASESDDLFAATGKIVTY